MAERTPPIKAETKVDKRFKAQSANGKVAPKSAKAEKSNKPTSFRVISKKIP